MSNSWYCMFWHTARQDFFTGTVVDFNGKQYIIAYDTFMYHCDPKYVISLDLNDHSEKCSDTIPN